MHAWISGRQLVAATHDPTFPERHFARSRALGASTVVGIIVAPFFAPGGFAWILPLLVLGLLAGLYPARRRIFGETWGFGTYVRYSLFSGVGMLGFWMLLASAPSVIAGVAAGDPRLAVVAAALLAALLVACQRNYPRFWLATHRATPLERPDLAPLFTDILSRATCPPPSVHRFGAPGGHVMNALALPHASRPAVAFGDAVLEQMEPREIAAIFAHEVAHLEHFDARRLQRMGMVTLTLIALSTGLTTVLVLRLPGHAVWLSIGIIIAIVGTLATMASRSQANETASDLRAVELTGDADALIDALTKLHVHLRLPRQWPHEVETSISHPSLARRVKAIRERAQASAPSLRGATIARTPTATMRIALDDARAYWFEGLPADTPDELPAMRERASSYRALAYEELSELRLVPSAGGKALKARDLTGKAWMVTIRGEDVAPLHEALAVVDARLGQRRRRRATLAPRLLAVAMMLALMAAGQPGVVLVFAFLLLLRPSLASLAALGVMAIARIAAAAASGDVAIASPSTLAPLAGVLILAISAIVLAWRDRRAASAGEAEHAPAPERATDAAADAPDDSRTILLALAASAVIVAFTAIARTPGLQAAKLLASPSLLSLAVIGTGVAAVLLTTRSRWSRRWGGLVGIAALVVLGAGGRSMRTVLGPPLRITSAAADLEHQVALDDLAYRLELSPGSQYYAVQGAMADDETMHDESGTVRWTVGALHGGHRSVEAIDLSFLDDERVLMLRSAGDSLLLSVEQMTAPSGAAFSDGWRQAVPTLTLPQLLVDVGQQRWTVVGRGGRGELVAFSGRTNGQGEILRRTWSSDSVWMQPLDVTLDGSLVGYSADYGGRRAPGVLTLLTGPSLRFTVWRSADGERVPLREVQGVPECRVSHGGLVCAGRGTRRTQLWQWMPGQGAGPLTVLPPGFDIRSMGERGAIVAVEQSGERVLVIDTDTGTARRFTLHTGRELPGRPVVLDARSSGSALVTLEAHAQGTRLGVYRTR